MGNIANKNLNNKVGVNKQYTGNSYLPKTNPVNFNGLANAGANIKDIAEKRVKADESLWVLQQSSKLRTASIKRYEDAKNNATPGAPNFSANFMSHYNGQVSEILKEAPSDRAARQFEESIALHKERMLTQSLSYETQAGLLKRKNDFLDVVSESEKAVFHDPSQFNEIYQGLFNSNLFHTLPEGHKEALRIKVAEDLAAMSIDGRISQIEAIEDFDNKIEKFKELEEEIDNGSWDEYLSADVLSKVKGTSVKHIQEIKKEIKSRKKKEYGVALDRYSSKIDDHKASIIETGTSVISESEVKAISEALDKPQLFDNFKEITREAYKLHDIKSTIEMSDPLSSMEKVEKLKPRPGDAQYASKFDTYQSAKNYLQNHIDNVKSDPASFSKQIMSNNKLVEGSLKEIEESNTNIEKDVLTNLAVQKNFGLPTQAQRILTNGEKKSLVEEINNLPADQIRSFFYSLQEQYDFKIDGYTTAYDKIIDELTIGEKGETISPNYSFLLSVIDKPVANDLINAIKQGSTSLNKALASGDLSIVKESVRSELTDFMETISPHGEELTDITNIYDNVNLLATYYTVKHSMSPSDAANLAASRLINDNYEYIKSPSNNDYSFYVPAIIGNKYVNPRLVSNNLEKLQKKDKFKDWFGKGKSMYTLLKNFYTDEEKTMDIIKEAEKNGVWMTNESGTGVYLGIELRDNWGVIPLINDDGERYEFKFDELNAYVSKAEKEKMMLMKRVNRRSWID